VSTRPKKVAEFLGKMAEDAKKHGGGFVVILEICGFHHWLVDLLNEDENCSEVIVIQPQQRSKRKTDRRDANALCETLWVNRNRLLAKQRVQGVRRVYLPTPDEEQDRQLTAMRVNLARKRTKTINQIRNILRRHNLEWDRPTKTFQTKKVRQWLKNLPLSAVERLNMDQLLEQWEMWHMLSKREAYEYGGAPPPGRRSEDLRHGMEDMDRQAALAAWPGPAGQPASLAATSTGSSSLCPG